MKRELEETRRQGTPMRPLQVYHMHNDPGWIDVPFHWHENAEVLLMQAGALDLQVEGRHYAARPGEVYFINPRELHGMQAASAGCAYLAFVFPLPPPAPSCAQSGPPSGTPSCPPPRSSG